MKGSCLNLPGESMRQARRCPLRLWPAVVTLIALLGLSGCANRDGLRVEGAEAQPTTPTPSTFLGTPEFAAPEQIKMEKVDAQSDLYAVAATLYFLLTGQAPFHTGDPMATMARIVAAVSLPSARRITHPAPSLATLSTPGSVRKGSTGSPASSGWKLSARGS